MQVQDLTRYLFLHAERHILNQQSTDSMRAFPGFPSWTKSWTWTSEPNFPDTGVHCVLPPPWTPKETLEFPVPPYMTSHPSGLMSPGNPPLITHKAECILVPPPSRNSLELTCPQKSMTAIYVLTPPPLHHVICMGNHTCVLVLTHNMNKHGFSVEDQ